MEGGRPIYREHERGLYLFFHEGRGAWAMGDAIGSSAPYAFVDDRAATPGNSSIYFVTGLLTCRRYGAASVAGFFP